MDGLEKCFGEYDEDKSSVFTNESSGDMPIPPPTSANRGGFGDFGGGAAGGGDPYVAEQDKEDKFRGMKRYTAVRSAEIDRLCGVGPPQSEQEREEEKASILRKIAEARANGVEPDFLDSTNADGGGGKGCILCDIWISMKEGERSHPLSEAYLQCKMFDLDMCTRREEPAMFRGVANLFNVLSEKYAREAGIETPQVVTADEVRIHMMMHDFSNPKRPILHQLIRATYLADESFGACKGVTPDGEIVVRAGMMDAFQKQGRYVVELSERLRAVSETVSLQLERGHGVGGRKASSETRAFRIRGGGIGKTKDSNLK